MKFGLLKVAVVGLVFTVSGFANASIIHTFDIDDIGQYEVIRAFRDGNSLSITFEDNTNFNNVQHTDIIGFKYNMAFITEDYGIDDIQVSDNGDVAKLFKVVDNYLSLNFVNLAINSSLITGSKAGRDASIDTNGIYSEFWIFEGLLSGFGNLYNPVAGVIDIQSRGMVTASVPVTATVPEPSTLAIFALGLIGLASRRFKKQS